MTIQRYSRSAMALHWALALLLAFQIGMGWFMVDMPQGSGMYAAFQLHKSVGILILLLSLARLAMRFVKPRPKDVVATGFAKWLARGVHVLLYAFMIGGPLTGWAVVSTARVNFPTTVFGVLPWPHLPIDQASHGLMETLHSQITWLGVALFVLHVAGALRHHIGAERQNILGRMVPAMDSLPSAARAIGVVTLVSAILGLCYAAPQFLYRSSGITQSNTEVKAEPAKSVTAKPSPGSEPAQKSAEELAVEDKAAAEKQEQAEQAVPSKWQVQSGGRLGFTASMNGAAIAGRFDRWSANILFGPDALATSKISVRVALLSADTADASRDETLKGPDFFGSAGGDAIFTSSAIRKTGADRYRADGTLTMNGKSRAIPISFNLKIAGDKATVTGSSQLDRTAFSIGKGNWAATDEIAAKVDVNFSFQARRLD